MRIEITQATPPAWYKSFIEYQFEALEEIFDYAEGPGYQLVDSCKGVLVKDCKIISPQEQYPTLVEGYI